MEFVLNQCQKDKIQVVRAIAIFMVIMTHTILWNKYELFVRPFINPAVAMFIFLSGLLTREEIKGKDVLSFYKRRLLRVFIPYTLWSIIYVVFQGSYDTAIKDYLTGNCCSTFYYILVYMQLVIIAPLAGKLIRSKMWWIGFAITPIAIVTEYVMMYFGVNVTYPYNINNFFVWFIFFYLGMFIRIRYEKEKRVSSIKTNILCIIFIPCCIALEMIEGYFWIGLGRDDVATSQVKLSTMCTAIFVCVLISSLVLSKKERKILKLFVMIGDTSFGLYLTHQLIMGIWGRFCPELIIASDYWFILEAIIVYVVGFIIIFILQKVFGKKIGRYIGVY